MRSSSWPLHDAKARFSALVEAAISGEAQVVTRRGKPAVVVVEAGAYERLRRDRQATAPSFIDHLLAIPSEPAAPEPDERLALRPRDLTFE